MSEKKHKNRCNNPEMYFGYFLGYGSFSVETEEASYVFPVWLVDRIYGNVFTTNGPNMSICFVVFTAND